MTSAGAPAVHQVFDRHALRRQRDRSATTLASADFLITEVAARLAERLDDVTRDFPLALELGCRTGQVAAALAASGRVGELVQMDLAPALVRAARQRTPGAGLHLVADEEALPFGADQFDLIVSGFSLHWVNDLPGTLAQAARCLKPDGLLLAAFPGGHTLTELRATLLAAELEATGGAAARVPPFVDIRDAGGLLQRAGLALPVADSETITVRYDHPLELLRDLRAMGEANPLTDRSRRPLTRATLALLGELYPRNDGGRIAATFEIVTIAGWKPEPSQPQPRRRGSGEVDLAQMFGVPEDGGP